MEEIRGKRYVPTLCVQTGDQEFTPFWDLEYVKDEECGEGFKKKDVYGIIYRDFIECYWDTKNKKLIFGLIKEVYPKKTEFIAGETVYAEESHNTMYETKVVDIVFETYDIYIRKFKKLESYEKKEYFSPEELLKCSDHDIYEFRIYKPTFVLEDGKRIIWSHQLKKKRK